MAEPSQASTGSTNTLDRFLRLMVEKNASDMFFSVGAPIHLKVEGMTVPITGQPLAPGAVKTIAYPILQQHQIEEFERELELNLAYSLAGLGRFRVNLFRQRGETAMVIRYIKTRVPTLDDLQMPYILRDIIMRKRGLVLMVGATGSGKSTTLAAMINFRNETSAGHIITIEDPIEFLHPFKRSIINQREVGSDTKSFENALKNAMREAPDVILIGEIREREMMEYAIAYAETGHLCLATLHANNANQALERILSFFPLEHRDRLFMGLSMNLQAIVSQRLAVGLDQKRVAAVEVLIPSPYIRSLIRKGEVGTIKEAMADSGEPGVQTFDQALYDLYKNGRIGLDEALTHADNRDDLALKVRLSAGTSAMPDDLMI